jgi:hypothetical protein
MGPDDAALERLRVHADPIADNAVAAMLGPWDDGAGEAENLARLAAANRAIAGWRHNADLVDWQAPDGTPEPVARALAGYLAATRGLPDWADAATIARAERIFMEQGLLSCTLLFCASLPECYVLPDLAEVLHTTGQLQQRTDHRIRATAAMIFPVMLDGGLTSPQGAGIAQVLKVRLIHAVVRHLVLHGGPVQALARPRPVACRSRGRPAASMHEALLDHGWDVAAQGLPCNQLELAYTLLTFGYVFARGMRTLRIGLPPEDEHALLHTWNVVGHLVGIGRGAMVEDMAAAEALFGRIQALGLRHPPAPDPRPPLARALMRTMAAVIPWRIARPMPVLLTRLLCGKAARSELGLNQQVGWPARALFALGLGLVRAVDAIGRTIRPDFSVARLVTRLVGVRLLSRLLMDQTRPLNLPTGLLPQLGRTVAGWREDARAPRWMRALEGRLSSPASWVAR